VIEVTDLQLEFERQLCPLGVSPATITPRFKTGRRHRRERCRKKPCSENAVRVARPTERVLFDGDRFEQNSNPMDLGPKYVVGSGSRISKHARCSTAETSSKPSRPPDPAKKRNRNTDEDEEITPTGSAT